MNQGTKNRRPDYLWLRWLVIIVSVAGVGMMFPFWSQLIVQRCLDDKEMIGQNVGVACFLRDHQIVSNSIYVVVSGLIFGMLAQSRCVFHLLLMTLFATGFVLKSPLAGGVFVPALPLFWPDVLIALGIGIYPSFLMGHQLKLMLTPGVQRIKDWTVASFEKLQPNLIQAGRGEGVSGWPSSRGYCEAYVESALDVFILCDPGSVTSRDNVFHRVFLCVYPLAPCR
ncbi:MAG TPA: hypothetical protein ENJ32_02220 [Crenotrichaceae bacterium]|nr:hypothetical protein [Crenotrichaceae bacterium]